MSGETLALIMFGTAFVGVLIFPLSWLLLSIFTPKSLLESHFKEPHFTQGELIMMASFPFFLMRTLIFGWALLLPRLDKKRNLKNIRENMPRWYEISLKVYLIGLTICMVIIFGIMAYLFIVDPAP